MRWSGKIASFGDRRIKTRFAWYPVKPGDEWIWIEWYTVWQTYIGCDGGGYYWQDGEETTL